MNDKTAELRLTQGVRRMKALSKFNAPLTGPAVLFISSLPVVFLFLWVAISPRLLSLLQPLEENAPFTYAVLHSLVGFTLVPWIFAPPVIAIYVYQRRYERKRRDAGVPAA